MPDAAASLRVAVEKCYDAFASMPRPQRLVASPLRDAEAILRTLSSAPLRELSSEQIGPYSSWAMTTVGTDSDYRHFLPRILELSVADPVWLGAEPPIIASRLKMASWRNWPTEQQSAVVRLFRAAFDAVLETHPHDGQSADEWLCGLASLGEPAALAFERWRTSASTNAALQMASFIIDEAKHLHRHHEVRGPFWDEIDEDVRREVARLLMSDAAKSFLQAAAEKVSEEDRFCFVDAALAELRRLK